MRVVDEGAMAVPAVGVSMKSEGLTVSASTVLSNVTSNASG